MARITSFLSTKSLDDDKKDDIIIIASACVPSMLIAIFFCFALIPARAVRARVEICALSA